MVAIIASPRFNFQMNQHIFAASISSAADRGTHSCLRSIDRSVFFSLPLANIQERQDRVMRSLLIAIAACFAAPTTAAPTVVPMNIVATANATATLSTLVKALVAGGLVDTLSGSGPFTVFAPTDLAFAQLPAGTLERLLDPHNVRQLQAILLYHVAAGNIPSTDFGPRQEVTTANGAQVLIVANMTAPPPYVSPFLLPSAALPA